MDSLSELLDPSDWLQTSLPLLTPLESSLRCQVCKDFYETPMITSCSHTFCSLCIRRCLTNDGRCPVCRSPDQEIRLRRNWSVQEIVDAFRHARPTIIHLVTPHISTHKETNITKEKRKYSELDTSPSDDLDRRATRRKPLREASKVLNHPDGKLKHDGDDDQASDFESDDGLQACPICQQRMREEEVFPHLDVHTQSDHETEAQDSATRYSPSVSLVSNTSLTTFPERLPQLNYSLFKENALRKKLVDMGIPSGGPKALLIRRHTEWVNLVNANSDSSRPRSKRELLQDLTEWDRSQGRVIPNRLGHTASASSLMQKDFDGVAWGTAHSRDFQRLIQEARKRGSKMLDESPRSTLENPEDVFTSKDVPISSSASISAVPASENFLHEEFAIDLRLLKSSEDKVSEANLPSELNIANSKEHE